MTTVLLMLATCVLYDLIKASLHIVLSRWEWLHVDAKENDNDR